MEPMVEHVLFSTEWFPIFTRALLFVCFFEFQYRVIYLLWPALPKSEKHSAETMRRWWAIKFNNVVHAAILGPIAAYALLEDDNMFAIVNSLKGWNMAEVYESILVTQESLYTPVLTTYSVGFFIWDLLYSSQAESFEFLMVVHHLISILVWPIALNNGLANFFLLTFMASELSSPFIHVRWYIRTLFGQGMAWIAITLVFILSFLVVRILVLPYVLFGLYAAQTWRHPSIPVWLRILSTSTLYLPSLFNIWWMWFIIKMCIRFLCPKKGKSKAK